MNLRSQQLNKFFAALIACVAAYILFFLIGEISNLYKGWKAFFDQRGSIYPALIIGATAMLPVSTALISYLVYFNKRTYYILLPTAHVVLLFSDYVTYGMVVLLLVWWFSKYAAKNA